ncbi:ABC transporter substrate-binding protein [Castellaniella sp.]|uniref:ABC transporter substrate-binding protein n=1 Tax=Castellaniella sp. TaxID=1955812 RepID=UPI003A906B23
MKPLPILRYLAGGVLVAAGTLAHAETLTVTHWGSGMYGAPFAVALEKGYFKDAGLDITGFITSKGGGTTVRNAMASEIPYGEVALSAAVAAVKSGVKLTIVHGGVISLADLVWVANKGSAISKIEDMKGKKLGYSSPKSVTDMVSTIALNKAGILDSVDRKAVGGLGSALTALRENAVDVIYMLEPVMSKEADTLKVAFTSSASIPHMTQTVGIVQTDYLKKHPDVIKKIIEARRKGVEFIEKHPDEAGDLLAKQYSLPPAIARSAIHSITKSGSPYWSQGALDYQGMDVMLDGLRLVKALDNEAFNWSTLVDESLLPKDLRSK